MIADELIECRLQQRSLHSVSAIEGSRPSLGLDPGVEVRIGADGYDKLASWILDTMQAA